MSELGQTEQGVKELAAGVAGKLAGFSRLAMVPALAQFYIHLDRGDLARVLLDEELARIEQSGEHLQEPQLYLLRGEAILMPDSSATREAKDCFCRAIEVARGQSAKWWELRATTSLARMLAKQGKRDEARAMLAEIYSWFTEGFDLPDMKDAKALLEELRN